MAVFKRNDDGSLTLVSKTKCCKNCGGTAGAPASKPAPESPEMVTAQDDNEDQGDASSN